MYRGLGGERGMDRGGVGEREVARGGGEREGGRGGGGWAIRKLAAAQVCFSHEHHEAAVTEGAE